MDAIIVHHGGPDANHLITKAVEERERERASYKYNNR